jgi:hypothetical protein
MPASRQKRPRSSRVPRGSTRILPMPSRRMRPVSPSPRLYSMVFRPGLGRPKVRCTAPAKRCGSSSRRFSSMWPQPIWMYCVTVTSDLTTAKLQQRMWRKPKLSLRSDYPDQLQAESTLTASKANYRQLVGAESANLAPGSPVIRYGWQDPRPPTS